LETHQGSVLKLALGGGWNVVGGEGGQPGLERNEKKIK